MISFSRFKPGHTQSSGTASLLCTASQLSQQLTALRFEPTYIAGFVSPHVDLDAVARQVSQRFPRATISLCTTAGELSSEGPAALLRRRRAMGSGGIAAVRRQRHRGRGDRPGTVGVRGYPRPGPAVAHERAHRPAHGIDQARAGIDEDRLPRHPGQHLLRRPVRLGVVLHGSAVRVGRFPVCSSAARRAASWISSARSCTTASAATRTTH